MCGSCLSAGCPARFQYVLHHFPCGCFAVSCHVLRNLSDAVLPQIACLCCLPFRYLWQNVKRYRESLAVAGETDFVIYERQAENVLCLSAFCPLFVAVLCGSFFPEQGCCPQLSAGCVCHSGHDMRSNDHSSCDVYELPPTSREKSTVQNFVSKRIIGWQRAYLQPHFRIAYKANVNLPR